jgi:hypothetical protein
MRVAGLLSDLSHSLLSGIEDVLDASAKGSRMMSANVTTAKSKGAQRTAAHRRRRKHGFIVVPVEVHRRTSRL